MIAFLFAWWFLAYEFKTGVTVVGPFSNPTTCETVRLNLKYLQTTACWEGSL